MLNTAQQAKNLQRTSSRCPCEVPLPNLCLNQALRVLIDSIAKRNTSTNCIVLTDDPHANNFVHGVKFSVQTVSLGSAAYRNWEEDMFPRYNINHFSLSLMMKALK